MNKILITLFLVLASGTSFAESPIIPDPVPTEFNCKVGLSSRPGIDSNYEETHIKIEVNSYDGISIKIDQLFNLENHVTGGFIILSANSVGDRKFSSIHIRTPSLAKNETSTNADVSTYMNSINNQTLSLSANVNVLDLSDDSSLYLYVNVMCDLTEL